jgi:general secretion pathway protein G
MKHNRRMPTLKRCKAAWEAHISVLRKQDKEAGVSLMEIMIAVTIMVILMSSIGIAVYRNVITARKSMALQHISTMQLALKNYLLEKGKYPEDSDFRGEFAEFLDGGKIPKDPWDNDYLYKYPGEHGDFDLWSAGPDGDEGNEDDIVSWSTDDDDDDDEG